VSSLYIDNVRCFSRSQVHNLKPLTILVGENSAGKSTFLSLCRMAWDLAHGQPIDFNEAPFQFGTFEEIASFKGGRAGRAKTFSLGYQVDLDKVKKRGGSPSVSLIGTFSQKGVHPFLSKVTLQSLKHSITFGFDKNERFPKVEITHPKGTCNIFPVPFDKFPTISTKYADLTNYISFVLQHSLKGMKIQGRKPRTKDLELIEDQARQLASAIGNRPYAVAPIRTRPLRTYDPLKEEQHPEGAHVPMILARVYSSEPKHWKYLEKALSTFGEDSGMFKRILVKRKGLKDSDPFQIRVKISGPDFNVVDVGYGVSQILPILVDSLIKEENATFLLQQPEVHLHPSAQAALGTFLAYVCKSTKKRFIVETHSDYLVDRIRMDIRDKDSISAKDVGILYFEKRPGTVRIHSIDIDDSGNLVSPPKGYRKFFLEEEMRFFRG
jgi:hypothetical protein